MAIVYYEGDCACRLCHGTGLRTVDHSSYEYTQVKCPACDYGKRDDLRYGQVMKRVRQVYGVG